MKCAPQIWRKYNKTEKKVWKILYKSFNWRDSFSTKSKSKLNKKDIEIAAHNMACQAIWAFREEGLEVCVKECLV